MSIFLDLDGELLHVLVVGDIVINRLLDGLRALLAVLFNPVAIELLVALLCFLLQRHVSQLWDRCEGKKNQERQQLT